MYFSKERAIRPAAIVVILFALLAAGQSGAASSGSEEIHFTILHTNDEHSALIPHSPAIDYSSGEQDPTVGGAARLAAALERIRKETSEPVLLMSGGDFLGGSPYSWLALRGQAVELKLLQKMEYDFAVIGNHEFDYGPDILSEYLKAAGYPESASSLLLLATNMQAPSDHPLSDMGIAATHVHRLTPGGPSIGIFGLLGDHAQTVVADAGDVKFTDPTESGRKAVKKLQQEGADIVVALTHSGVQEDRELAQEVAGIDLIVGGHCHTALQEPVMEGDTIIVQAGSLIEHLGYLQLAYDHQTGSLRVRNNEEGTPFLIRLCSSVEEHPAIAQSVQQATEDLNRLLAELTEDNYRDIYQTVARSDFAVTHDPPKTETPMGNLVCDALCTAVEKHTGRKVDFAFQANGQIRGPLIPGKTADNHGKIAAYEVLQQTGLGQGGDGLPGYGVVSLYLTGEEVWRVMETSALLSQLMGDSFFLQVSGLKADTDPHRAVLLELPVMGIPVPTYRAVRNIKWKPDGMQGQDYVPLARDDERLFHVVTDHYVANFVPRVGDMLPRLSIEPKDEAGDPVNDLSAAVVHRNEQGDELKVWQAVLDYLQQHEDIPRQYAAPEGRINQASGMSPMISWIVIPLVALGAVVILLVKVRKAARK